MSKTYSIFPKVGERVWWVCDGEIKSGVVTATGHDSVYVDHHHNLEDHVALANLVPDPQRLETVPDPQPKMPRPRQIHHRLTNQVTAQDALVEKANRPDAVVGLYPRGSPVIETATRIGCYVHIANGLSFATYFVGLGRNEPTDPWRCIVERTG